MDWHMALRGVSWLLVTIHRRDKERIRTFATRVQCTRMCQTGDCDGAWNLGRLALRSSSESVSDNAKSPPLICNF